MARTGRPRKFDREEALTSAMHLFWRHGYEGASLERLRHAMGGISAASFYGAFGSKAALYREALGAYLATHGQVLASLGEEALTPRERIARALLGSARMQTDPAHPSGCMVALSATVGSADADALGALTAAERSANREAIARCVAAGIACGELGGDTDAAGLVGLLDGLLLGLAIQARDGVPLQVMERAIERALAVWGDAPAPAARRPGPPA